ncbi:type II toxin-antitoxin system VapC family toxin [Streptomyces sp. MST-110588]|uniref:type II toxin-antitoxin system VapC family toxin n=1 Tax=Streptomyces sp. MST-110588 TaxID=2833628 RepID=UPI001F5CF589|nr:type II toxin-antitoxin system VapC family toxin [Streptomyces sp. MST-110588]UNO41059.1 type II toxin-antitoxin system VapC family toxin [Streptomyces sp. MST-110588]
MIVVDNSVLISALVDAGPTGKACAARLSGERLAAPAVIDFEALHVLRGLLLGNKITQPVADRAARCLPTFPVDRVPTTSLVGRIWELRGNYTAYDAAYVALAEQLGAPLVTSDAKMQRANGARCVVEVIR